MQTVTKRKKQKKKRKERSITRDKVVIKPIRKIEISV